MFSTELIRCDSSFPGAQLLKGMLLKLNRKSHARCTATKMKNASEH